MNIKHNSKNNFTASTIAFDELKIMKTDSRVTVCEADADVWLELQGWIECLMLLLTAYLLFIMVMAFGVKHFLKLIQLILLADPVEEISVLNY